MLLLSGGPDSVTGSKCLLQAMGDTCMERTVSGSSMAVRNCVFAMKVRLSWSCACRAHAWLCGIVCSLWDFAYPCMLRKGAFL